MIKNLLHIFRRTGAQKITIYNTPEDMLIIRADKFLNLSSEEPFNIERTAQVAVTKTLVDDIDDEKKVEDHLTNMLMEKWQ